MTPEQQDRFEADRAAAQLIYLERMAETGQIIESALRPQKQVKRPLFLLPWLRALKNALHSL